MGGMVDQAFTDAVADFGRALPRLKPREVELHLARLRWMAATRGLSAAAEVADGFAAALARDSRGTPVAAWLDALTHAADCDPRAAPVLLATIGVRFAA